MKITKKLLAAFICTFFLGLSAYAQNDDFDKWDEDGDELLEEGEFRLIFEDDDSYSDWDMDDDDKLDLEEWKESIEDFYDDLSDNLEDSFDDWDLDEDGFVSDDEYIGGNFRQLDKDEDNKLNNDEYVVWIRSRK